MLHMVTSKLKIARRIVDNSPHPAINASRRLADSAAEEMLLREISDAIMSDSCSNSKEDCSDSISVENF